ncbi:tRNA dimethylallyltransferase, mitochondrial [Sparassis crispa]|uniref:tRNA dimethylallyltransferase, mitochondrial n=1 Tax=Sparassis crispa TaxID=139825 RepID=A0A401GK40_9APHY|nr:tRNA dimethylallyltransferase, mitochondrial [Sparassis crispa]GBE82536.1 tRNA dimethylallyltransferase, mitochondrial [Sparassis crispa]
MCSHALNISVARPLIAICGTTGVGKSKLAIELALALAEGRKQGYHGARIINADSMQVYAGVDVITNKVPFEERCGVEHVLMDFKKPGEQYIVTEWVRDAIEAIDEAHKQGKIPIVVGGTSYWMQNLIFPNRLASFGQTTRQVSPPGILPPMSEELAQAVASLPPELLDLYNALPEQPPSAETEPEAATSLYALLSIIDPERAKSWHWRDTRKTLREVCIIRENGRTSTAIFAEQAQVIVPPRYRTLCLWLYANTTELFPRLNARVDQMIEQGLLQEIQALRSVASPSASSFSQSDAEDSDAEDIDHTLGIYQCIGFKEFFEYLNATAPSEKLFNEAVERMKVATRRYSRRQISWIRNQMLPLAYKANARSQAESETVVTPVYLLDATELGDTWTTNVGDVAEQLTHDFLNDKELPDPFSLSETARHMLNIEENLTNARRKVTCALT